MRGLVTPEQLRLQLLQVRHKKALVVLLVDLLDASGTMMAKVGSKGTKCRLRSALGP